MFVSYRYNPCPCTGQGVSCRDGEKRPHITFWTNPSTWHCFSCDTCPHRDPHSMFYNLFFFFCYYKLNPSSFHWLFRGALCPLVSVHSISPSPILVKTNFLQLVGRTQTENFISILKMWGISAHF